MRGSINGLLAQFVAFVIIRLLPLAALGFFFFLFLNLLLPLMPLSFYLIVTGTFVSYAAVELRKEKTR